MIIVFVHGFKCIKSSTPLSHLAFAMILTTACMITRGLYRSIELFQGWEGYLNTHGQYVIGLDGALMVISVMALNFFNPGMLLGQAEAEKGVREFGDTSFHENMTRQSSIDTEMV